MNLEEYERMYAVEEKQWWFAGMRAISFSLLDGASLPAAPGSLRLLDTGCGTGQVLRHLAARGRAVGVDLSPEALRLARARGVAVARAELLSLPFPDATFDCVTSFDVIYHRWVRDDAAALAEIARVLRPGGLLLLRVPALRVLRGAHDEAVHSRHRYTRGEVRRLLQARGLEVLRDTYANSLLFPVVALRRTLDRLSGRRGSDVGFLPAPLELVFGAALRLEARLLRRLSLPIGASVFALARKPFTMRSCGEAGVDSERERERVAEELRRVRDAVRERALLEPRPATLPPARAPREPRPAAPEPEPAPTAPMARPDNAELNRLWRIEPAPGRLLRRLRHRLLRPFLERQQAFNSRQVQFDNALLDYIDERLTATHRHYDAVLGLHGRHMGEIDERHLILQEELVAHVHDLVKRIDLVLAEAERGRLGLEFGLRDLRARLARLEERLLRG